MRDLLAWLQTSALARAARRLRWILRRRRFESAMDEEMHYHVEREVAERVRHGMSVDDALRSARRDFGGIERHKDDARDERGLPWLSDIVRDFAYASRVVRRNPGFAAPAALTVAVGLGSAIIIFSFLVGILIRPLPYENPRQLVALWQRNDLRNGGPNVVAVTTVETWRERARSFSGIAAMVPAPLTLDEPPADRITGAQVSPEFFRLLGARAAIGRTLEPGDEVVGRAPVVVLSDALWRARFGADADIVGKRISIDGDRVTVIGVMDPGFDPPRFGWMTDQPLWLPFGATASNRSWGRFLHVIARMRPGVSLTQARRELASLSVETAHSDPENRGWSALVVPLREQMTGDVRMPLIVFTAAVVLLVLMAAVNVASLLRTFSHRRAHEFAVRRAIGASFVRIARQQAALGLSIAILGVFGGIALAVPGTRLLTQVIPPSVARVSEVRVDAFVVAIAALLAVVVAVCCGVVSTRSVINGGAARASIEAVGPRAARARGGARIIGVEVAVGLVLSVLAALMVRTVTKLRAVDLGFQTTSVVAGRVHLRTARFASDASQAAFFAELLARLRATPSVASAGLVTSRPFACCAPSTVAHDPSVTESPRTAPATDVRYADGAYFSTMRIPVLAGHVFARDERADGPIDIVVSRALARAVWGKQSSIGKMLTIDIWNNITGRVIGEVGDVHLDDPRLPVRPTAYVATARFPSNERDVVMRGDGGDAALIRALRGAVAAIDPQTPVYKVESLTSAAGDTMVNDRIAAALLSAFALLALGLAATGVFGVLSGFVQGRRKEIGIRRALGEGSGRVLARVVRQALVPAAVGAGIGVAIALALSRLMSTMVFGIATWDVVSFVGVSSLLIAVAALSALLPAWRATRLTPLEAIRMD